MDKSTNKTHFGYQEVSTEKKQSLVDDVFSKVSNNYDLMNDLCPVVFTDFGRTLQFKK